MRPKRVTRKLANPCLWNYSAGGENAQESPYTYLTHSHMGISPGAIAPTHPFAPKYLKVCAQQGKWNADSSLAVVFSLFICSFISHLPNGM